MIVKKAQNLSPHRDEPNCTDNMHITHIVLVKMKLKLTAKRQKLVCSKWLLDSRYYIQMQNTMRPSYV